MKGLLLLLLLAASVTAQQVKGCQMDRDKFTDVVTYRCNGTLKAGIASTTTVRVSARVGGAITFSVFTSDTDWRLSKASQMNVLLDGSKRLTLSNPAYNRHFVGRVVNESLTFTISAQILEEFATAKAAELKLGEVSGKLETSFLTKLAALSTKFPAPQ